MYRVLINGTDVSPYVGNLSWNDSIETLGVQVSFSLAANRLDPALAFLWEYTLGDSIQIVGKDGILTEGIIVEEAPGEKVTNFTAYDMAWYLNKSTVLKQFKKMQGNECVRALCKEIGIPVECKGLDAVIDKIYKDKTVSEVIQDIISQSTVAGPDNFFMEFSKGKLIIQPFERIEVKGSYEIAANDFVDIATAIGGVSLNRSIIDLKNSVLVITGDKEAVRVAGQAQDQKSIDKYGKLQTVIQLDEKDFGKAELVAKNELRKQNKIKESYNVSLLGDDKVKAGRIIRLDFSPSFDIVGDFLIKESSHTVNNNIHKADLVLEVYADEAK